MAKVNHSAGDTATASSTASLSPVPANSGSSVLLRANFHHAPTTMRAVPGVTTWQTSSADCYGGPAAGLVAAGLATADMFPGQPGRPRMSIRYRPLGVDKPLKGSWYWTPGFMSITRRPHQDYFVISLRPGYEEVEMRTRRRENDERKAWLDRFEQNLIRDRRQLIEEKRVGVQSKHRTHLRLAWSAPGVGQ